MKILIEGDTMNVGSDTKWGQFFVLSPSSEAWDNLKDYFVKEYVKCVHSRPPQGAFENQDAYWEMLLRIAALKPLSQVSITKNTPKRMVKICDCLGKKTDQRIESRFP